MINVKKTSGGLSHASPFIGDIQTASVRADISELTTAEVDEFGRLKPGVPFKKDGTLADGTAGEFIFGVSVGNVKIVDEKPTNTTLGANTGVAPIAVATIAQVNRDIAEDVLGRAYSANEIAAFDAAGSKLVLTRT